AADAVVADAARLLLALGMVFCAEALAEERSVFTDPEDGAFDASEWLLDKKGFLPVPIIVTEPAVGYGAGAALLWFRESLGERRAQGRLTAPDIFGGVLAATENGTTLAGAFGMVTFAQEYWRWRGFIGRPDVNLDFYGEDTKIGYNLEGWATTQMLQRRLGESENFVAASRGWKLFVESVFYSPDLGGDEEYQTHRAQLLAYFPLGRELILGGRVDARAARGDVPFY